jgi:hypothetical protein
MLLNLAHTCHGSPSQMIELSTKYLTSQSSPHMKFVSLPTEYVLEFKIVWCYLTISQMEGIVLGSS